MDKKFLISWVVILIVGFIGSGVIHGMILHGDYSQLSFMRPEEEAQKLFHFMILAHVSMAAGFAWIYLQGRENKPWLMQGIRFGVAVFLLTTFPFFTIYYVVQMTPGILAVKQVLLEGILTIILGIVIAFLNRDSTAPVTEPL